jgi:Reverse transcriptase (RNA-dependent DNA polymerase)/gag-polypeptide of LTR copia-type/GAG-pre-integrase domain/Integrase core domain
MSEVKLTLPLFDGKPTSDFHLWQLRLFAILESEELSICVQRFSNTDSSDTEIGDRDSNFNPTSEQKRKAAAIIINGLGDKPLRVVSNYTREPQLMVEKLRERYASTKLTTRMSLMSELQSLRYTAGDMGEYIDRYAGILDRLETMSAKVPEELAIIMFLHSMGSKFEATIAALRTMGDDNLSWDDVTARLLEEANTNSSKISTGPHSALVSTTSTPEACPQCLKPGHSLDRCWWNPRNPNNRIGSKGRRQGSKASAAREAYAPSESAKAATLKAIDLTDPEFSKPSKQEKTLRLSVTLCSAQSNTKSFLLDSGASAHMCPNKNWLHNFHKIAPREIRLGDNSVVSADAAGELILALPYRTGGRLNLHIDNVLYVPDLGLNLLSCSRLAANGVSSIFHDKGCDLVDNNDNGDIIARALLINDLYWIQDANPKVEMERVNLTQCNENDIDLWHNRLGHTGKDKIASMLKQEILHDASSTSRNSSCKECSFGKQTRGPFKGHLNKARKVGDVIHSDVLGPVQSSLGGYKYFVSFIDEWTRYVTLYPMKHKSEVLDCFKNFHIHFENQNDVKIKTLHSDNGGEYAPVSKYLQEVGITSTRSAPYTPEANGIAERMNRTLIEMVRTTLAQSGLPIRFWIESLRNAVRIRNSIPHDSGKSPYEMLKGSMPNLSSFKPFGCLAMMHIGSQKKLDVKSLSCVLLCTLEHRNYRLYDINNRKIVISRNVTFDENEFPFKRLNESNDMIEPSVTYGDDMTNESTDTLSSINPNDKESSTDSESSQEEPDLPNETTSDRRYPSRERQPPSRYAYSATVCHQKHPEPATEDKCHSAQEDLDTPTLKQALNSPHREQWIEAISEEMESLNEAQTWDLLSNAPQGKKIFPSKFVLKVKRNSDRTVERYKARLVLLGHLQRKDIDYFETYSPVVDFTAVRIALVIACQQNLSIHHLDVKCAFLYGEIDEEIYMRLPDGYGGSERSVCKLRKSIYGLKQAPRAWNSRLTNDLKSIGYIPFQHAESIFWRERNGIKVYLLVYVDDFLVITSASSLPDLDSIKNEILGFYQIKDLGKAEYFLGINIKQSSQGIKLSQDSYIQKILDRFNMSLCKSVRSPMLASFSEKRAATNDETAVMLNIPYREAIGALMFLSVRTRPDIAVAVATLAMHVQQPLPEHWDGVKRIMRYLQGTSGHGLTFNQVPVSEFALTIFADADWATNSIDRRSRTGIVSQLGGNTVWWKSRKQASVAVSSCEAEYMAVFESAKDAVWLRNLLCEFGSCPGSLPTSVFLDNQGSISWAKDDALRKVKHISLRYHFTHDLIKTHIIDLQYIPTEDNRADSLTKPLTGERFVKSLNLLGVCN